MQPIAGYSNGHDLAGGRPSAAKTGTNQLGDTGANRDAWMVGFTPSLSTAVWVGTTEGTKPLVNKWGSPVYGSGLPSDIWKTTMDGALEDTDNETFPKPTEIGGYAGVPQAPPPPPSAAPPPPSETVIQPTHRSGAGHHDPVRSADHGAYRSSAAGRPAPRRSVRQRRSARRARTAVRTHRLRRRDGRRPEPARIDRIAGSAARCRRSRWRTTCAAPTTATCPAAPTRSARRCRRSSAARSAGTR